jgi:hypothetical protein
LSLDTTIAARECFDYVTNGFVVAITSLYVTASDLKGAHRREDSHDHCCCEDDEENAEERRGHPPTPARLFACARQLDECGFDTVGIVCRNDEPVRAYRRGSFDDKRDLTLRGQSPACHGQTFELVPRKHRHQRTVRFDYANTEIVYGKRQTWKRDLAARVGGNEVNGLQTEAPF